MKKAIALLMAAVTIASLAGCNVKEQILDNTTAEYVEPAETDYDNLILAAEKESLRTLIVAQKRLIEDVFVLSHLPVDESAAITHHGAKYAPVKADAAFTSYESLLNNLKAIYTEDVVETIISNPPIYMELDGVFYYNLDYKSEYFDGSTLYPYDWSEFDFVDNYGWKNGNEINFAIEVLDANKTDGSTIWIMMRALNVDGSWKLCEFYDIVK